MIFVFESCQAVVRKPRTDLQRGDPYLLELSARVGGLFTTATAEIGYC